jgi:hypothetical protein
MQTLAESPFPPRDGFCNKVVFKKSVKNRSEMATSWDFGESSLQWECLDGANHRNRWKRQFRRGWAQHTQVILDHLVELGLSSGDDQHIPALLVEIGRKGLSNAISSTSND